MSRSVRCLSVLAALVVVGAGTTGCGSDAGHSSGGTGSADTSSAPATKPSSDPTVTVYGYIHAVAAHDYKTACNMVAGEFAGHVYPVRLERSVEPSSNLQKICADAPPGVSSVRPAAAAFAKLAQVPRSDYQVRTDPEYPDETLVSVAPPVRIPGDDQDWSTLKLVKVDQPTADGLLYISADE